MQGATGFDGVADLVITVLCLALGRLAVRDPAAPLCEHPFSGFCQMLEIAAARWPSGRGPKRSSIRGFKPDRSRLDAAHHFALQGEPTLTEGFNGGRLGKGGPQ